MGLRSAGPLQPVQHMSDQRPVFIDIGVNLTHPSLMQDIESVLDNAWNANVRQLVLTGTNLEESERCLMLCQDWNAHSVRLVSTVGIHPHDAKTWQADTRQRLLELLKQPEIRAVGECGLDFNRDFSPRAQQEKALEAQLELAAELKMPVFLHERDASQRMVQILSHYRDVLDRLVIHCFTGEKQALYRYLDLDLHIGITGWICDERRGEHLLPLLKDIPDGRLMLETDAPYLLPRTLSVKPKTRRNEPAFLPEIARVAALHHQESIESLARHTSACASVFFGLSDSPVND